MCKLVLHSRRIQFSPGPGFRSMFCVCCAFIDFPTQLCNIPPQTQCLETLFDV